ncbi:unnamed protein product [Cylicocyclus nassatus]|uniref:Uncharacterized protein n=1 Tax=Cylicocyclus nassatus TaxID=53992 RepID=A0AA36H3W4_CYLNA|nr:unnamed protein product [Cylicocyclus nassatus]
MISSALSALFMIVLPFCASTTYDGPCMDMKSYKESAGKVEDARIGCISFEYRSDDAKGFCKKYDVRKLGVADMQKFVSSGYEGNCFMEADKVYCMCSGCHTNDIVKLLRATKSTKKIADEVEACKKLTTKPPDRPTTEKINKISTEQGFYLDETESTPEETSIPTLRRTRTTTAATTTTLDYEIPDKPDVKPSPEMLKYHCALIENFFPPYHNYIPEVEKKVTQADERMGTSNTPSIIYSSRKQEELYGTNTLLLLIVNLIALLGIVIIFRAVLNATLHLLFPDYGLS